MRAVPAAVDHDGFGDDADPGSPLAALAGAMSSVGTGAPPVRASTEPADILDDDFVIPRQPGALQNLLAIVAGSRRNIAIAAGGAGLLVLVCLLTFCGGSARPNQVTASRSMGTPKTPRVEPAAATVEKPAATPDAATAAVVVEATAPVESARPADASGPTAEELAAAANDPGDQPAGETGGKAAASGKTTKTHGATPTSATPSQGKKTLGGKEVVLEYDKDTKETGRPVASAPKSDQSAIQKARVAYGSGNQRLFAGDAGGAIKFYRQSLGFYPGYVAGYRGLGLAFAQQGDKPKALQALKQYLTSVPTAKDAAIIRKRVASLQGK